MQIWFFQKRRIVRLIDKVFDKQFNLKRVEEFKSLIDRRSYGKRGLVLENFRRNVKPDDDTQKGSSAGGLDGGTFTTSRPQQRAHVRPWVAAD
jgi:hypothetical protein